jgi:hypothetical protein
MARIGIKASIIFCRAGLPVFSGSSLFLIFPSSPLFLDAVLPTKTLSELLLL